MPREHQNNVIAFIRDQPHGVGRAFPTAFPDVRTQVHHLALNRAARRVGTQGVDTNTNAVRLSLDDAIVGLLDLDDLAINRADDAQRNGRYVPARIAKQQEKQHEQPKRQDDKPRADVNVKRHAGYCDQDHRQQALPGNERNSLTAHQLIVLFGNCTRRSLGFSAESIRLECAPRKHLV